MCPLIAACVGSIPADAAGDFERFATPLESGGGYRMRVASHEEDGARSEELTYRYASATKREPARLTILEGRGAGSTIAARSDAKVDVSVSGSRFFIALSAGDARVTSLRGTTLAGAGFDAFIRCVRAHRASMHERPGPLLDGIATTALIFDRTSLPACDGDSSSDRAITADVVYLATSSGVPLMRKRFVGREIVERWRIRDFSNATPRDR